MRMIMTDLMCLDIDQVIYFIGRVAMAMEVQFTPHVLCSALQEVSANFAYKMLFLEIRLSGESNSNVNKSVEISQLTALYMKAVQSLQGRFQEGFLFFHNKIQNLMKKRSVVEELFRSVNSSLSQSEKTMNAISKAEVEQRREEYDLRKTLHQDTFDHKKVKEMIKNAELKINMIESKIKTGIFTQEETLANRIKLRRLKSESSLNGDRDEQQQQPRTFKKMNTLNMEEDFIESNAKPRKKSSDKREKLRLYFNSFSNEIKI